MIKILSFCIFLSCASCVISNNSVLDQVKEVVHNFETRQTPRNFYKNVVSKLNEDDFCKACNEVVEAIISKRKSGSSKDTMNTYVRGLCNKFTDYGTIACKGLTDINLDTILYIIDNKQDLTSERVCAIFHQASKCIDPKAKQWLIDIPPHKKEVKINHKTEKTDGKFWTVFQLTDVHYDPYYKEGSKAVCGEPLCCHTGTPTDIKEAAGRWGDYHVCDAPPRTFTSLYERVKQKHLDEIDAVYFTGDIVSHRSWSTSRESNTADITGFYQGLQDLFKRKKVYPILGNHEPHPADNYSPENLTDVHLSTRWIMDTAWEEWSRWLPQEVKDTVTKGGYYSVLVKPGFRVIGINSNFCFVHNLWLFYDDEDPYGQLAWLVQELIKAEANNEKVHILSHVPAGHELCHIQWSKNYNRIVQRFADTISAQFNGHTHEDEIEIFYSQNGKDVVNVAFNGGSLTPFIGNNPMYRIYKVLDSDARVQDYQTYTFNLTEANNNSQPKWYQLYSFKNAYGLNDLSNESLAKFVEKLSQDKKLQFQYFRYMVRDSDVLVKQGCNDICLKNLICKITAVEASDAIHNC